MRKIFFGALAVFMLLEFMRKNNLQEKGPWVTPSSAKEIKNSVSLKK